MGQHQVERTARDEALWAAARQWAVAEKLMAAQAGEAAPRSEPPTMSAVGFLYKTMWVSPTCLSDAPWAVLTQNWIVLALARSKDEAKQYVNMLVKG